MSWLGDVAAAIRDRRETRRVLESARVNMARAVETIAAKAMQDLADDDLGWRKLGDQGGDYDYSNKALADIRRQCISLWNVDPTIGQAVSLLQSGALGAGVEEPTAADERLQEIISTFWGDEDNQLALFGRQGQILLHLSLMLEGERFLTLFTSEQDAEVRLSDVAPGEVVSVITHPENRRRVVLYRREYNPEVWDPRRGGYDTSKARVVEYLRDWRLAPEVAEGRFDGDAALADMLGSVEGQLRQDCYCYHVRTPGLGLRGVPAVWRAFEWARAHGRSLSTMMDLASALARFAWSKKVTTNSAATLESFAESFYPGAGEPTHGPGAVDVHNQNVDLQPVNISTGGTQVQEATARQMHLQIIRPFGFGEHWYSDATKGNLATATAMELPAIWRIEDHQALFGQVFRELCEFAVSVAVARKVVSIPEDVDRAVQVNFPDATPTTPGDTAVLIGALSTGVQSGLLDEQEASRQAYEALGTNEINAVMERQYPPERKMDGEAPVVVGEEEPNGSPAALALVGEPPEGPEVPAKPQAQEALRVGEAVGDGPFSPSPQ